MRKYLVLIGIFAVLGILSGVLIARSGSGKEEVRETGPETGPLSALVERLFGPGYGKCKYIETSPGFRTNTGAIDAHLITDPLNDKNFMVVRFYGTRDAPASMAHLLGISVHSVKGDLPEACARESIVINTQTLSVNSAELSACPGHERADRVKKYDPSASVDDAALRTFWEGEKQIVLSHVNEVIEQCHDFIKTK